MWFSCLAHADVLSTLRGQMGPTDFQSSHREAQAYAAWCVDHRLDDVMSALALAKELRPAPTTAWQRHLASGGDPAAFFRDGGHYKEGE